MADLHAVIAATGWTGPYEVGYDFGRVAVTFGARRIEAVSVEAAILFIEADTRARAAALTPDAEADDD
jgi:hypothetical protein